MTLDTAQNIIIILAALLAIASVIIIAYINAVHNYKKIIADLDIRYVEDGETWQQALLNVKKDRDTMLSFWSYHYYNIIERTNNMDYPEVPSKKANTRYNAIVNEIKKLIDNKELTLEQTRTLAHVLLPIGLLNYQIEEQKLEYNELEETKTNRP